MHSPPDFHECSYGFRPNRNAKMAVEKIAAEIKGGKTEVYDADLSSYFDTIPHDTLKGVQIGSKVTTIGKKAFSGCKNIKTLTLGSKVKIIEEAAFYGLSKCKKMTIKTKKLTESSVGKKAFGSFYSKVKVKVPSSKKSAYKTLLKNKGLSSKATIS